MSDSVHAELTRMRVILAGLEAKLDSGEVEPEGLPEFKSAVDEIRLRVWGLLTAAGTTDPRDTAERFRLRRAAELCRGLSSELASGSLQAGYPEWLELQQTATQLTAAIAEHTGRAA